MLFNLQASYRPCLLLKITVLRGHNITLGSFDDFRKYSLDSCSVNLENKYHISSTRKLTKIFPGSNRTKLKQLGISPICTIEILSNWTRPKARKFWENFQVALAFMRLLLHNSVTNGWNSWSFAWYSISCSLLFSDNTVLIVASWFQS